MKKLLSVMLGLTLILGTVSTTFAAQDKDKTEGKKKKSKKKKDGEDKKPVR